MRIFWSLLATLALTQSAWGQSIPNRPRGAIVSGFSAGAFDPDARAYFQAMTTPPDGNHKVLYNVFFVCVKGSNPQSSNVWTSLAWLSIIASHDAQAARINAKNPAQIATASGSPTFTVDRGYTGVPGTSGYLETGIADNTTAQDSLTLFVYVNQSPTVTGGLIGLSSGNITRITGNSGLAAVGRVHSSTALISTISTSTGFIAYAHTAAAANVLYRGGVADVTDATGSSTAPTADTFGFLRSGASGFSDARIGVAGWSSGLTGTQIAALNYCAAQYLTAVGGN